jgi:hypothetical protein
MEAPPYQEKVIQMMFDTDVWTEEKSSQWYDSVYLLKKLKWLTRCAIYQVAGEYPPVHRRGGQRNGLIAGRAQARAPC